MKHTATFLVIILVLSFACNKSHKFANFNRNDINSWEPVHRIPNVAIDKTYILKIKKEKDFFGKEAIVKYVSDPKAKKVEQFSYFVFQKDGRVYYNTKVRLGESDPIVPVIDPYIYVCDDESSFSLQGFYSLLKTAEPEPDSITIQMEFERKKGGINDKKHYYILARMPRDLSGLHIKEVERPRRNTPLRLDFGNPRKRYITYFTDHIFAFRLIFHAYETTVKLDYKSCEPTFSNPPFN